MWCALAVAGAEAAFLAGLLMLGTVLLTAEATIATTDAVLLACVLGVQGVLLRLYRAARDPDAPRRRTRTGDVGLGGDGLRHPGQGSGGARAWRRSTV